MFFVFFVFFYEKDDMFELLLAYSISSMFNAVDDSLFGDLEPLMHSKVDLSSEKDIFVLTKFVAVEIFTFLLSDIISARRL